MNKSILSKVNPAENYEYTNSLIQADCLDFLAEYEGSKFDLVYLDPPFFLNREFKLESTSDRATFQGGWSKTDFHQIAHEIVGHGGPGSLVNYLSWLLKRIIAIHQNLADNGAIYLHIGTREAPYVNLLLDRVFGFNNWRSTITWQRSHPHNNMTKSLGNVADIIYYYSKSSDFTFNLQYTAHDEKYLANSFNNKDEKGNYALAPIIQERTRTGHFYEFNGVTPPNGWRVKEGELERLESLGYIHWGANRPYKKVYLEETQGALMQNIWTDIYNITRTDLDKRHYPTQKPLKLLERIVSLSSNEGDLIYDPFCGSGTTLVAAAKLGRKILGTDISADAIEIASRRLAILHDEQLSKSLNKLF